MIEPRDVWEVFRLDNDARVRLELTQEQAERSIGTANRSTCGVRPIMAFVIFVVFDETDDWGLQFIGASASPSGAEQLVGQGTFCTIEVVEVLP